MYFSILCEYFLLHLKTINLKLAALSYKITYKLNDERINNH